MTPRQRFVAAGAAYLMLGLAAYDTSVANVSLPTIATSLRIGEADVIWVANAYQIGMVTTMLPLTALGEIVGHRRIAIAGTVIFMLAALVCALAPDLTTLLIGRALGGIGAAGMMGVNGALLQHIFPPDRLGRAFARSAMVMAVSVSLGPTMATAILSVASWPWLFGLNVPASLIALAVGLRVLPQTPRATHRFDIGNALLSMLSVGLFVGAFSAMAHRVPLAGVAGIVGASFLFGWLLLRRQRGHPAPVLPVDLLANRAFALTIVVSACAFCAQQMTFIALPFFLMNVMQRAQFETGLLITIWPASVAIGGWIAGRLVDRRSTTALVASGLALSIVGLSLLATRDGHTTAAAIALCIMVSAAGFGFFQPPNLKAIMQSAPRERSGGASGMIGTSRIAGQAIGAALVALCFIVAGQGGPTLSFAGGCAVTTLGLAISLVRLTMERKT